MDKYKSSFYIMCLLLSITVCVGCSKGSNGTIINSNRESENDVISSQSTVFALDSENNANNKKDHESKYKIEELSIKKDNRDIKYPMIKGLNNNVQEKWNKIIKDKVSEDIKTISDDVEYNLNYAVMTKTDNLLSLYFEGNVGISNSEDNYRFMYTYNIDMKNGNSIRMSDRKDISVIADKLQDSMGIIVLNVSQTDFTNYLADFYKNKSEVETLLDDFDFKSDDFNNNKNKAEHLGYSYYQDDKLVLCVEVNHSLGDYVRVIIN